MHSKNNFTKTLKTELKKLIKIKKNCLKLISIKVKGNK